MATNEEMYHVIEVMDKNDDKWLMRLFEETRQCFIGSSRLVKDIMCRTLIQAQYSGQAYYGVYGEDDEPCTYWLVGDYKVTYLSDDLNFSAGMLTKDMMDGLIIEEV